MGTGTLRRYHNRHANLDVTTGVVTPAEAVEPQEQVSFVPMPSKEELVEMLKESDPDFKDAMDKIEAEAQADAEESEPDESETEDDE